MTKSEVIEFPLEVQDHLYAPTHIETQLTLRQARALRSLCDGLQRDAGEAVAPVSRTLRLVRTAPDAVRWLLDRIADQANVDDEGKKRPAGAMTPPPPAAVRELRETPPAPALRPRQR